MLTTFAGVLAALLVAHQLTTNGAAAATLATLGLAMAFALIDGAVVLVRTLRGRAPAGKGKP